MKVLVPRQSISIGWLEFIKAIVRLPFKSGCGKEVKNWEESFAGYIGVPYSVSFISERAGTYFALKALMQMNKWENPEIICPSYTFFSVPWAAKLAGWELRFADVLGDDLTMDPKSLIRQINPRTKAVIVTHLNGKPCRMKEIGEIVKIHNLRLLEDCAHSIGAQVDERQVGAWDIGCFSFGDGKSLGTFCGGMVTTSDPRLAEALSAIVVRFPEQPKLRILKKWFDSLLLKVLTTGIFYPLFLYPMLRWFGYLSADSRKKDFLNFIKHTTEKDLTFKFSDMQALAGMSQLESLDRRNSIRRANSSVFRARLSKESQEKMLPWDGKEAHTMLHDSMVLDSGMHIVKESLARGIDVRLDYCSNCRNLPGMENFPGEDEIGRKLDGKIFFIPNHLGVSENLAEKIAFAIDKLILESNAISTGG